MQNNERFSQQQVENVFNSLKNVNLDRVTLSEHIEEFSQRLIFSTLIFTISIVFCFLNVSYIVPIFQAPVENIKFLQFAPGEYFLTSLKLACFSGILIVTPIVLYQILLYLLPAMTKKERNFLLPIIISSLILFVFGLLFGYLFLAPTALDFLTVYGSEVVEPFWSFDQYFDFISTLLFVSGLAFQVPVIQIALGLLGLVSSEQMLLLWKYVVVISTILAAIITPSTDPVTQILMLGAFLSLYFAGVGTLLFFKK